MIPKLCAIGVLLAFVGVLLSEYGFRSKRVFGVLCATMLMIGLSESMLSLFDGVISISDASGISEVSRSALKVIGVGYVFGFCADMSRELGESSVANVLTIAGRIEILLLVFPYFEKILGFGMELVK